MTTTRRDLDSSSGYHRRRADDLLDKRLDRFEKGLYRQDEKLDRLEGRINVLFGALALLGIIANIAGPIVAPILVHFVTGGR